MAEYDLYWGAIIRIDDYPVKIEGSKGRGDIEYSQPNGGLLFTLRG